MKHIKITKLIKENFEAQDINAAKKHFFQEVKKFSSTANEVYSTRKLKELAKSVESIANIAEQITLNETDGWFDGVSVKRDMKSVKEAAKLFAQTCNEMAVLQQRLESCYEDVGSKLGKYYDLSEAMDPINKEDSDIDNDGDSDKSDKYLNKRRDAISAAIKK